MFVSKLSPIRTILYKQLLNNQLVKHNSTIPTVMSYIKDKGTAIPFASNILTKEEFDKYELFRNIKLGNYKWLDNHTAQNPLKQEEKSTVVSYINGLKEQPYSIPNCFIGYWCTKFGFTTMVYSISMIFPAIAGISTVAGGSTIVGGSIITGSTAGLIGMNAIGLYGIAYGIKLVISEFKSPYYNYDEMLRICNKKINEESNKTQQ